jgi:hypothetical protein
MIEDIYRDGVVQGCEEGKLAHAGVAATSQVGWIRYDFYDDGRCR